MVESWFTNVTDLRARTVRKVDDFFQLKPRLTVLLCCLILGGDVLAAYGAPWLIVLLVCCALIFFFDPTRSFLKLTVLLICPWLGFCNFCMRTDTMQNQQACDYFAPRPVRIMGAVEESIGEAGQDRDRLVLRCRSVQLLQRGESVEARGLPSAGSRVICSIGQTVHPAKNDLLQIDGMYRTARKPAAPWEFDERTFLQRHESIGFVSSLPGASSLKLIGHERDSQLDIALFYLAAARDRIRLLHESSLGKQSGDLLSSMVIGNAAVSVDSITSQQFRTLSLSHIIAASGFNLTVVTAVVWWLCRLITRNRVLICIASISAVLAFVGIAGLSASVERAAIMCGLALAASCVWRRCHLPASLALAALLSTLCNPIVVKDIGFQLSYAATMGIVLAVGPSGKALQQIVPRMPKDLVELCSVGVVAQLSVLPIQLFYFWKVGTLGLPANLLVTPMVPVITIIGFASSALAVPGLHLCTLVAHWLDAVAALPLNIMMTIISALSGLHWGWATGPPAGCVVAFYYVSGLFAACCLKWQIKRPRLVTASIVCFALTVLWLLIPPRLPAQIFVTDRFGTILVEKREARYCQSSLSTLKASAQAHAEKVAAYFGISTIEAADQDLTNAVIPNPGRNDVRGKRGNVSADAAQASTTFKHGAATKLFARDCNETRWQRMNLHQLPQLAPYPSKLATVGM